VSFDEAEWWADCANTLHEEQKQLVYATRMGLIANWSCAHPPEFDIEGRSVLDIGGGPVSLLLKCVNRGRCVVVDPSDFPLWVFERYRHCKIDFWHGPAEEITDEKLHFDEAWIYNVLQHVGDPAEVIERARKHASTVRVFEWIDIDPYPGHPHRLEREGLDEWLDGHGFVAQLNERGCVGTAYYGVFQGALTD
jgi:hypothetical protein